MRGVCVFVVCGCVCVSLCVCVSVCVCVCVCGFKPLAGHHVLRVGRPRVGREAAL